MEENPDMTHSILESLDQQREMGNMTDVVLVCGGRDFPAHKNVLSAASKYFEAMFKPGWDESDKGRIELPDLSSEEMEIILPFLYKRKIKEVDDPSMLKKLLKTSHMLQCNGLCEFCYKKLCDGLSCSTFLEIFNLFELYYIEGMTKCVLKFSTQNFTEFSQSEEFLKLTASQLQKVIQNLNPRKTSMDDTIKALIRWSEVEVDRQETLKQILLTLDLQDITSDLLTKLIRDQQLAVKNHYIFTLLTAEATARTLASEKPPKFVCFGTDEEGHDVATMYDIRKNQWSESKILPFKLIYQMYVRIIGFGGYIYLIGGKKPSTKVIKYNPNTNTIASIGKLSIPVREPGVGVLYESIYVVNGSNKNEHILDVWQRPVQQTLNTVQRYNPVTGDCEMVANTNNARQSPHVFTFSNYLYVLGYYKGDNSVERYDPARNEWTVVTAIPGKINYCTAALFGKKVFVVPSIRSKKVKVYDFTLDTWVEKTLQGGPRNICELHSVSLEGKCVMLVTDGVHAYDPYYDGNDGDGRILHVYDPESDQWIRKSKRSVAEWYKRDSCVVHYYK